MKLRGTYLYQGFPLIRINTAINKAFLFPKVREAMAANWIEKYGRQGVGLCNNVLRLIAFVRPDGTIHQLQPPFRKFEMWQMANAPKVHSTTEQECACAGFFDPEVGGPWRERGLPPTHHHPFCQFSRTAVPVFVKSHNEAVARSDDDKDPQARPDEWLINQLEAGGS